MFSGGIAAKFLMCVSGIVPKALVASKRMVTQSGVFSEPAWQQSKPFELQQGLQLRIDYPEDAEQ